MIVPEIIRKSFKVEKVRASQEHRNLLLFLHMSVSLSPFLRSQAEVERADSPRSFGEQHGREGEVFQKYLPTLF